MIRGSRSYRFTADTMSAADMIRIGELRKIISDLNKISKQKYRVVLRGRKPSTAYDYFGNVIGGLANASKLDVYVYDRNKRLYTE